MENKMIYIGIVGSRKRNELERILRIVRDAVSTYGEVTVVSGGAIGIDDNAKVIAHILDVPIIEYLPKHDEYNDIYDECDDTILIFKGKGNDIYFERNKLIAVKSDELHAFPLNQRGGTMNTIKHFRNLGKEDKLFIYD